MSTPPREPPAETVTFMFTDLEGSTNAEHERIVREALSGHRGAEVDTQGDAFVAAFTRAKDAVGAAVEIQQALAAVDSPDGVHLTVRIGLDSGEAQVEGDRYRGLALHRAARIGAAAHGGQILVSAPTRSILEEDPAEGVRLRELGRYKLRHIANPERLFQVDAPGLRTDFPAPGAGDVPGPWWRRRRLVAGALALAVAAAAVAGVLYAGSGGGSGLAGIDPNHVGRVEPASGQIVSEVGVGTDPTRLAPGAPGALWVVEHAQDTVGRVDTVAGKRLGGVRTGVLVDDLAFGHGRVWAFSNAAGQLLPIDPRFAGASTPISVCPSSCGTSGAGGGVAVDRRWVWVTDGQFGLDRVDPGQARIVARGTITGGAGPVATGQGRVWVGGRGGVTEVDPARMRPLRAFATGAPVTRVAVGEGGVWAAAGSTVVEIDPAQGTVVATVQLDGPVGGVAAGAGAVWAVTGASGTLWKIDPARPANIQRIPVGVVPTDVAVASGAVWVAVR